VHSSIRVTVSVTLHQFPEPAGAHSVHSLTRRTLSSIGVEVAIGMAAKRPGAESNTERGL
jgi:hypothetical protein